MAVTVDDVLQVATLARIHVSRKDAAELVGEMNGILAHMDALSSVDTAGFSAVAGVGAQGLPLRSDSGPADTLRTPLASFAPSVRDGLILVPRLQTHESAAEE